MRQRQLPFLAFGIALIVMSMATERGVSDDPTKLCTPIPCQMCHTGWCCQFSGIIEYGECVGYSSRGCTKFADADHCKGTRFNVSCKVSPVSCPGGGSGSGPCEFQNYDCDEMNP
jgi:hypothetical protein